MAAGMAPGLLRGFSNWKQVPCHKILIFSHMPLCIAIDQVHLVFQSAESFDRCDFFYLVIEGIPTHPICTVRYFVPTLDRKP